MHSGPVTLAGVILISCRTKLGSGSAKKVLGPCLDPGIRQKWLGKQQPLSTPTRPRGEVNTRRHDEPTTERVCDSQFVLISSPLSHVPLQRISSIFPITSRQLPLTCPRSSATLKAKTGPLRPSQPKNKEAHNDEPRDTTPAPPSVRRTPACQLSDTKQTRKYDHQNPPDVFFMSPHVPLPQQLPSSRPPQARVLAGFASTLFRPPADASAQSKSALTWHRSFEL